jgi:PAS domain S-box-containing protein
MTAEGLAMAASGVVAKQEAPGLSAVTRLLVRSRGADVHPLLDALPAAIYTTDAEGRITFCNRAAIELSGHRAVLGRDKWCVSWRLRRPDGTPLAHDECPMAVTLRTGKPVRGIELLVERPDGTCCPVLPYPTPLHDAAGRLIGAVNMLVDLSERRGAERQQRVLVQELNHRVKNNMQMLHALLDMARRDSCSEEARAILGDTGRRVAAMAAAQKVLYEANHATSFEARNVIEAVCENARWSAVHGTAVTVSAVPGRLSNDAAMPLALLLSELLTNALAHGVAGRIDGRIRVALTAEGEGFCLEVEDDGPGFTPGKSRRSFSGLGLVSGLARQLGGELTITCRPGACCRVRISNRHRS